MKIGFTHNGKEYLMSDMTKEQFQLVVDVGHALSRAEDVVARLTRARGAFLEKRTRDGVKLVQQAQRITTIVTDVCKAIATKEK